MEEHRRKTIPTSASEKEHRKKVPQKLKALVAGSAVAIDEATVDEKVTDTKWFFLLSMTQFVVNGEGLPGRAFFTGSLIRISDGD
ncbi:Transcription factor MYC2 [Acorus calamus]|uniref:Transcription factor MYC2 n=1 Tax=Acorus calamus TaxID=4465 RepID=A0AAV9CGV4_ACOCL|nr:Transcription factor MYC2 [Acorus calamus]